MNWIERFERLQQLKCDFADITPPAHCEFRFLADPSPRVAIYDLEKQCFVASVQSPIELQGWVDKEARKEALLQERIRSWDFLVQQKS